MTNEKAILRAQVLALSEQLERAEETLKRPEVEPEELREAMAKRFANLFNVRRGELNNLIKDVGRGSDLLPLWGKFALQRKACEGLFAECLGYLGGLLLRKDRLDWGINEIADALLAHVSAAADDDWRRLTVLAAGSNSFAEMTEIIRLPFPDFTVWNLPVAVHELGHYHSTHNKSFATKLEEAKRTQAQAAPGDEAATNLLQKEDYLHEFFADLFAVYTLGPAYAACCFVTRFSPGDANFGTDGGTHPSHARRGHLLILALEEMDKTSDPHFTGAVTALKNLWQQNLQSVGVVTDAASIRDLKFNLLGELFYSVLGGKVSSARYAKDGWARARSLLDQLPSPAQADQLLREGDTVVDIINGAWAWRLSQPSEDAGAVVAVNRKALEMCRLIARR